MTSETQVEHFFLLVLDRFHLTYCMILYVCTEQRDGQPRSQGFSLFVIGKAGKGPGTGRSSMYSDWSMTSTLLCK